MSPETTAGEVPQAEGPAAVPDSSSPDLRTLAVEASGAGLELVDRWVGRVRERLDRSVTEEAPRRRPYKPRGRVIMPALLGFAAMMAIAVGASLPSSPFKLEMPGVWFFGVPSAGGASTWGVYFVLAAVYGGLLLLMRVWWGMTRLYARCTGVPINRMMWVFALWSLPMLVIAPLVSRDAYSYAAQGE
ncbi:MAG: hypothetical protein ACRDYE_00040, partial [Acidimicrobiales bacterium]